jgi:transposase
LSALLAVDFTFDDICFKSATRWRHSSEEKIRIVLEGLRGEDSIAELCRREGLNQNVYNRWSKEFLETGKKRLAIRDSARKNQVATRDRSTMAASERA